MRGSLWRRLILVIFVQDAPISVSAVPFGPGIDIWCSCRFIGALMRSLCVLPGGLGRFVPCSIGANHCRLRHIGWEKCGHGLTSRPRESASELFLDELLSLFRYPPKSDRALLNGTLPLRYFAARFAFSIPTWRLPVSGQVSRLVAAYSELLIDRGDEVVGLTVLRGSKSGPVGKRFRLNRKTPAHLAGLLIHSRPRVWKRVHHAGFSGVSMPDHTRRRCDNAYGGSVPEDASAAQGEAPLTPESIGNQPCQSKHLGQCALSHEIMKFRIFTNLNKRRKRAIPKKVTIIVRSTTKPTWNTLTFESFQEANHSRHHPP